MGIVGAGRIVEDAHLPVLANLDGVRSCWIADTNERRSALLSRMYSVPAVPVGESLERALDGVDVCLLAIPLGVREPYLEACAARDVAVLSEKPFAIDRAQHARICEMFPAHAIGVALQRRHYRTIGAIESLLRSGRFGRLESVELRMGAYDLKSGGANTYLTDARLSGGGVLIELGVHWLDQVLVSVGAQEALVQEAHGLIVDGIDYEVVAGSLLTGPAGTIPVRAELSRLRPLTQEFVYRFREADVRFGQAPDSPVRVAPVAGGARFDLDLLEIDGAVTVSQAFHRMWRSFLAGLDAEQPAAASATTALPVTRWIEDIYRAVGVANPPEGDG